MITKRFATISTESYFSYTCMLYYSLIRSNPEAELTVFCDSEAFSERFPHSERVILRVLPSIREMGVKRAKFDLYVEMCDEPFTYLDSDMIVLEDLSCLFEGDMIAACPDTLEECPFIENRQYPWFKDPALQNRRYCNTGLLFFPPSMRFFLERIRELSREDECWKRYIIPGKLYDNHFFCAMLNRLDVEFRPLDSREFGIKGLRSLDMWNVARQGDHLIHQPTGKLLRLAHFAYGQDPDYAYARMPSWLAAFLQDRAATRLLNRASSNVLASPRLSVRRWLEGENGDLVNKIQEDFHLRVLDLCGREIDAILADPSGNDCRNETFFQYPEEFNDLLYTHNGSKDLRWKALVCNRAYLTPLEYEFVEECIRRYGIKHVVESGAGETSILFRRHGCSVVSIEWQEGEWSERARAAGANVHIVPFDSVTNTYAGDQLRSALAGVSSDLLFVDSPVGGERRRRVPEQFLEFIDPRYILVHDVSRDHRNVFEWMRDEGSVLAEYYPSRRGILLIERKIRERTLDPITIVRASEAVARELPTQASPAPVAVQNDAPFAWEISTLGLVGPFWISGRYFVPVLLANRSDRDIGLSNRIHLSYHWRKADPPCDTIVFEGLRSEIRPDLRPGESRRILCEICAPDEPGRYLLEWDLVEEGVTWFAKPGDLGRLREVEVLSLSDAKPPVRL
jgi:hypothetical protein